MAAASVGLRTLLRIHVPCRANQSYRPPFSVLKAYDLASTNIGSALSPSSAMSLCNRIHELEHRTVLRSRKRCMVVAASGEEDESAEPAEPSSSLEAVADVLKEADTFEESIFNLKKALIDSLYGSERGLRASSETRAEVAELISQLEAKNPSPAPTDALFLLNGKWILEYTSFSELFLLLAAGVLPFVKVGEISQTIDSEALTIQNTVSFTGPLTSTSLSASASFEVLSPKRVQIKFEEGAVCTPQLANSIKIPENIEVLGQKIDLSPLQGILRPLTDAASSVAKTISGQPPIKISLPTDRAQSWLLTTFLDTDLRVSRGDGGSVFVLVKEGNPLLEL